MWEKFKAVLRRMGRAVRAAWLLSTFVPAILGLFSFLQKLSFVRAIGGVLARFKNWLVGILEPISITLATVFVEVIRVIGGWLNELVELYRRLIFDRLYQLLPQGFPEVGADIIFVACFAFAFAVRAIIGVPFFRKETEIDYVTETRRVKRGWWDRFINGGPEYVDKDFTEAVERQVNVSNFRTVFSIGAKRFLLVGVALGLILLVDAGFEFAITALGGA